MIGFVKDKGSKVCDPGWDVTREDKNGAVTEEGIGGALVSFGRDALVLYGIKLFELGSFNGGLRSGRLESVRLYSCRCGGDSLVKSASSQLVGLRPLFKISTAVDIFPNVLKIYVLGWVFFT